MGERMGPNTVAAFHAGADFMRDQEADDASSDDEAYLDDAALAQFRDVRVAEISASREAAARAARRIERIAKDDWRHRVVDASAGRWVLVHLHDENNALCEATLEALEQLPPAVVAGVDVLQIPAEHAMPRAQFHLLPAIFGYRDGRLAARLIGAELLRDARAAPTAHELEFKLAQLGIVESALLPKETQRDSVLSDDDDDDDDEREGT